MRAPTPREQAAIMGASYALMFLGLRAWDHLTRWRAEQRAETEPARLLRQPGRYGSPTPIRRYFRPSDGSIFVGSPEWIAEMRARYEADNPAAN